MNSVNVTVAVPPDLLHSLGVYQACRKTVTEGASNGVESALRDHFMYLQGRPRADGFQPGHFWDGDPTSVSAMIEEPVFHNDGSASISIDSPKLRHKLEGGVIKASDHGKKYLTIPANNEVSQAATGARSYQSHIEWVPHPDGGIRPALVSDSNYVRTSRSRKTGEVKRKLTRDETKANTGIDDVLFWLVKQVSHKPMPEALPNDSTLGDSARAGALAALDALVASNRGAA